MKESRILTKKKGQKMSLTKKEYNEFMDWYNKTNPTADQMNDYWKEKNKNKPKEKDIKVDFTCGLNDNYQGLGSGNYTLEEYAEYELNQQDVR